MKQNLLLLVSSNGLAAKLSDEIHVLHRLIYHPVHSPLGSFDLNYFLLINIVVIHVPHVFKENIFKNIFKENIFKQQTTRIHISWDNGIIQEIKQE